MKRFRTPKLKDGELRMYWGKFPYDCPDVMFAWQGDSSMKRDSRYLYYALGCDKPDINAHPPFSKMNPSFIKELELRGYDLTTIKFSIMKKRPNHDRSNETSTPHVKTQHAQENSSE